MADYTKKNVSEIKRLRAGVRVRGDPGGAFPGQGPRLEGDGSRPPAAEAGQAPGLRPRARRGRGDLLRDRRGRPGGARRRHRRARGRATSFASRRRSSGGSRPDADGLEYVVFGTSHEGDGAIDNDFWAPEDALIRQGPWRCDRDAPRSDSASGIRQAAATAAKPNAAGVAADGRGHARCRRAKSNARRRRTR